MQTVLVTGANGFIGEWCIVALLERGYAVRATLRSLSREPAVRAAVARASDATGRLSFCAADLTKDDGWDEAAAGCDYVLHVASPLGTANDPDAFVGPARDGTLRVLAAATKAGAKRAVVTSAAAAARPRKGVSDETIWADPSDPQFDAYRISKILAERAAWDFMADKRTELATILPGAVFGPILSKESAGSTSIIARLLRGRPPGIPKIGLWIVDVRDLAELHVRAMEAPEAVGERFLAAGDFLWMSDIAAVLREKLGKRARKVPTRRLSNPTVRFLSLFAPQLRAIAPLLGVKNELTTAKARRVLGFAPRPARETIVDCAESLIASL